MNRKTKKVKTREEHIEEVLLDLGKDLLNFRLTIDKRDKTIQEYVRLLKLTKIEYQKLFNENKILKEKLEKTERKKNKSKNKENIEKKRPTLK